MGSHLTLPGLAFNNYVFVLDFPYFFALGSLLKITFKNVRLLGIVYWSGKKFFAIRIKIKGKIFPKSNVFSYLKKKKIDLFSLFLNTALCAILL